jgi:multisubunit Na+/H+ antiporter MnhE subunit
MWQALATEVSSKSLFFGNHVGKRVLRILNRHLESHTSFNRTTTEFKVLHIIAAI